jgi:hypothetical protein
MQISFWSFSEGGFMVEKNLSLIPLYLIRKIKNLRKRRESGEESEGIKYYSTENAEISRDALKSPAKGLDKFGEQDIFDPKEADEHQTNRDRNQNSDLSERFFTHGLHLKSQRKKS